MQAYLISGNDNVQYMKMYVMTPITPPATITRNYSTGNGNNKQPLAISWPVGQLYPDMMSDIHCQTVALRLQAA